MSEKTLLELMEMTEDEARSFLERVRWPDGPACVHCGDTNVVRLEGEAHRAGVIKCRGCRKQLTVTVGTIFESSHIPLKKWVIAFHLMCSSKKGISAKQLQRNLGLKSYKSAWHMAHRIRHAMRQEPLASMLKGTVEVDETYVGGKPRRKNQTKGGNDGKPAKRIVGRGTNKVPVVALVEREGALFSWPVDRVDAASLKGAIREVVDKTARIITDEWVSYKGIGKEFDGGHETVNHGQGEYVRGDVYTNSAESYFALLKRGVHGVYHHVSKQHLLRYCDEFSFRWTHRKRTDEARTTTALRQAEGKRLLYKRPA